MIPSFPLLSEANRLDGMATLEGQVVVVVVVVDGSQLWNQPFHFYLKVLLVTFATTMM
jgi:hypothetical protein